MIMFHKPALQHVNGNEIQLFWEVFILPVSPKTEAHINILKDVF